MFNNDLKKQMWLEACELLKQAERLQRHFFQPGSFNEAETAWEPPVDIIETDDSLVILVALPGVKPEQVKIYSEPDTVIITGHRPVFGVGTKSRYQRLEIPYGRFFRKISVANGDFEIHSSAISDGCLQIILQRSRS
jgi:HSP20 family molecular chaperone IbpA